MMQFAVEVDAVTRIAEQVGEWLDLVRNAGQGVTAFVQRRRQSSRLVVLERLQQPEQIDDLVIAPVTDVAPRVVRVFDLPINTRARDAIRIVTIRRRSVQKDGDHGFETERITLREAFPVLKNVAPVALIIVKRLPRFIACADGETIPRTTRVAVATAKSKRQILAREANQLRIGSHLHSHAQLCNVHLLRQRIQPRGVAGMNRNVPGADETGEINRRKTVTIRQRSTAHAVEQDVREMMHAGG